MISVVIPIYNAEKYISKTIESVLQQTYKEFELILVNDGSTDSSLDIIRRYENIPEIQIVDSENKGPGNARNIGLEKASGKYIIFFDADDVMLPCLLETLVLQMENENCDLSIGCYEEIDSNGHVVEYGSNNLVPGQYSVCNKAQLLELLRGVAFPNNKLFKMQIILENNLRFIDTKLGEDLNFYIKYLQHCKFVCCDDTIVCQYRIVQNSLSRKNDGNYLEIIKSFEELNEYLISKKTADSFIMCIKTVQLQHYVDQFGYYPFVRDKDVRAEVFNRLSTEVEKLCQSTSDVELDVLRKSKKVILKSKLRFIFLSHICIWFYRKKYSWMMGDAV